jgi:hypothetical protein
MLNQRAHGIRCRSATSGMDHNVPSMAMFHLEHSPRCKPRREYSVREQHTGSFDMNRSQTNLHFVECTVSHQAPHTFHAPPQDVAMVVL